MWQTDMQTTLCATSVALGCIYSMHAMRPKTDVEYNRHVFATGLVVPHGWRTSITPHSVLLGMHTSGTSYLAGKVRMMSSSLIAVNHHSGLFVWRTMQIIILFSDYIRVKLVAEWYLCVIIGYVSWMFVDCCWHLADGFVAGFDRSKLLRWFATRLLRQKAIIFFA